MMKPLKGLVGAAALVGLAMAMPVSAEAQCAECAKAPTTKVNTVYRSKTVNSVRNVTRYRDVNNTRYQKHVTRIVNVTRVQPITRVHVVTRVHNRTVILRGTQSVSQTATLPGRTITTGSTQQINHAPTYSSCNCR